VVQQLADAASSTMGRRMSRRQLVTYTVTSSLQNYYLIFPIYFRFRNSDTVTWSPTLREEHRLRVFENRVLRRIFGAKRDHVTGDWRKLYNEVIHNLYSSPNIIRMIKSRRMRWDWHLA
jgi:hypothetical protein